MKNIIYLIATLLLNISTNFAQLPNWQWANGGGGTDLDGGYSTTTDAFGNIYITGTFYSPTVTFGSITLSNAGFGSDIYIAKYNSSGNLLWAKRSGGIGDDGANSSITDGLGNTYVTGYFSSNVIFGSDTIISAGESDILVLKYDSAGNVAWVKRIGGTNYEQGNSISLDSFGNLYVTGRYESSTISFGASTITNTGYYDIFILKLDTIGDENWAKGFGGIDWDEGACLTTDIYGNIYLTGSYKSFSINFNTTTITNVNNTGVTSDVFVAKLDALGNIVWANSAGGWGEDEGRRITIDLSGNLHLSGNFDSPFISVGVDTLYNLGGSDIFILKYDSFGNVLAAKAIGGGADDVSRGSTIDTSNNICLTGAYYSPTITFDQTVLANVNSTSTSTDIFIVKFDSLLNVIWAIRHGNQDSEIGNSIIAGLGGIMYLGGSFSSSSLNFGTSTLLSSGSWDVFVTKFEVSPMNIEQYNISNKTSIYPNPFNISTTIKIGSSIKNGTLTLRNCTGQLLKEIKSISGSEVTLYRDNLQSGIYFFQLTEDEKLIKADKLVIIDSVK